MKPILIHIPHSSLTIPTDERKSFLLSDERLNKELLTMTDLYTDELFDSSSSDLTPSDVLCFPVSRLVCDPERFRSDDDECMSSLGMGAVYSSCHDLSILKSISPEIKKRILTRYYDPHHEKFEKLTESKLQQFGHCLIIDAHSFPNEALPYELLIKREAEHVRPDICIGTDDFHTPYILIEEAVTHFNKCGLSVALNSPFSGTIVPMRYYGKDMRVSSIMIEINRRLYMNDDFTKSENFDYVKTAIDVFVDKVSSVKTS